jgi:hypothetical protein
MRRRSSYTGSLSAKQKTPAFLRKQGLNNNSGYLIFPAKVIPSHRIDRTINGRLRLRLRLRKQHLKVQLNYRCGAVPEFHGTSSRCGALLR